jgi:hypothetical protein
VTSLHITNGDCAADLLRQFVDGQVTITADPLHEGPAPRVDGDAWYQVRARHLTGPDAASEATRAALAAGDQTIAAACRRSAALSDTRSATLSGERHEIVLWFEHDLFDQLGLIRTLDLLAGLKTDATDIQLICIDRFPGIERFIGLGQLTADQLASLYPSRRRVTRDQFAVASAAWDAFRSPDPRPLLTLARRLTQTRAAAAGRLPFLGDALMRFFAEFPSVHNGLSRTDELALSVLRDGPLTAGELFSSTQDMEPRPFLGDWGFYDTLETLASARVPLMTVTPPRAQVDLGPHVVALTDAGRDVLAGRRDHIALNGIDVWRGGVHLAGTDRSPWRWDAHGETLVS